MKTCSPSDLAVSMRRGSTNTTRPPRRTIADSRAIGSGRLMKLIFETAGLEPATMRQRPQLGADLGERLRPRDLDEAVADALLRCHQPRRRLRQLVLMHALVADVAAADHVLRVGRERDDALAVDGGDEPAGGFADAAP